MNRIHFAFTFNSRRYTKATVAATRTRLEDTDSDGAGGVSRPAGAGQGLTHAIQFLPKFSTREV
jgi:hypothetical protein